MKKALEFLGTKKAELGITFVLWMTMSHTIVPHIVSSEWLGVATYSMGVLIGLMFGIAMERHRLCG